MVPPAASFFFCVIIFTSTKYTFYHKMHVPWHVFSFSFDPRCVCVCVCDSKKPTKIEWREKTLNIFHLIALFCFVAIISHYNDLLVHLDGVHCALFAHFLYFFVSGFHPIYIHKATASNMLQVCHFFMPLEITLAWSLKTNK